jgi:dTDP-4-amino-4,6-dideoxygalactose transaminase
MVHDYDCFRGHPRVIAGALPEAARAPREVLSLPVHPHLTEKDVDRIVDVICTALGS